MGEKFCKTEKNTRMEGGGDGLTTGGGKRDWQRRDNDELGMHY